MTKISKKSLISLSFIICYFSFGVALTSCQFEDEDFFDESASLRVEHTNKKVKELLVKPENGWVMQYFCGTGVAHFEGFNILARFDAGGKVTLASNHRYLRNGKAGRYTEYSSIYELLLEDGPVLALNTWNDVLTPFVDPVSPWQAPGALNKDGAGMQGDNNFVIMKYGDDEILLRGERYSGRTRLVPCDRPWQEYLAACDSIRNYVANGTISSYIITDGADTLYLTGLSTGRIRYSDRLDDPLKNDSLSAVYTPKGLRLERPDTIGKSAFQEFVIAPDNSCLQTADGGVRIIAQWDDFVIHRISITPSKASVWVFDTEMFSDEQKAIYEAISTAISSANKNWSLASLGMGSTSGSGGVSGLVMTAYLNTKKSSTRSAGMSMNITKTGPEKMKISAENPSFDANVNAFIKNGVKDLDELLRRFAATLNGEYSITPNDYFSPTGAVFTPIGNGTKFKLN